ncbi:hypothetical protein [Nocardiopsis alborubida]|uniref:Uncharacterized protein n=1 Tax=Nocardiopsis alborubida TaxID=146802 RepID=A0A7X6MHW5_9ACTN|nr:hypothetical protein [Nocardiopsis alborubida]NKZ01632.1 hypothetical protein [Nocardiopsis alborubida]
MPTDVDPDEIADVLVEYPRNPDEHKGELPEAIALLNNIGLVAFDGQKNGGTFSSEELQFLTGFYDALEEAGGTNPEHPCTSYNGDQSYGTPLVGGEAQIADDLPIHEPGDALLRINSEARQEFLQILLINE